jgi:hypothetical protein
MSSIHPMDLVDQKRTFKLESKCLEVSSLGIPSAFAFCSGDKLDLSLYERCFHAFVDPGKQISSSDLQSQISNFGTRVICFSRLQLSLSFFFDPVKKG